MSLDTAVVTEETPLMAVPLGATATVSAVEGTDEAAFALLDLGLRPGVTVRVIRRAPFGCPLEIALDGARFAIRCESARRIRVLAPHGV